MFEFVDHTADLAVRLTARDAAGLFQDAARALTAMVLDDGLDPVEPRERRPLRLEAEDGEALLVDFLNELLFRFDTEGFLTRELELVEIRLGPPATLTGTIAGERFDPRRHRVKTEVKAATFHGLAIRRNETGLTADVVFDL